MVSEAYYILSVGRHQPSLPRLEETPIPRFGDTSLPSDTPADRFCTVE